MFKIIILVMVCFIPLAGVTDPTGTAAPSTPTEVLLAQMCVSEVSWQKDVRECTLMMEVNYKNAKRNKVSVKTQTRRFNAYFKQPDQNRKWIQYLNAEGAKPKFWPSDAASWKVHRRYWLAYLTAARELAKKRQDKWYRPLCVRADDYGGRCDDNGVNACDTPKMACARKISCIHGKTLQAYWTLGCCRSKNRAKCFDTYKK